MHPLTPLLWVSLVAVQVLGLACGLTRKKDPRA